MKKTKYYLWLAITIIFFEMPCHAQPISNHLFGVNAWMPDSIGSHFYNGKLHKKWQEIRKSNAQIIRMGGIAPDKMMPTHYQYLRMVDSIKNNGMEPVMQVAFNNKQYSASQAADLVKYINITKGRKVKYWIISNEPNLTFSFTSSSQVAPYLKSFSSAMKAVDPGILIVGPETAGFYTGILNGLTTPGGPDDVTGKDAAGRYYVDIISFHSYPMHDGSGATRASVISRLTSSGDFQDDLSALKTRVANCNAYHGRTGAAAVKMAVTEANINYHNSFADPVTGTGSSSFLGGQFWCEMLSIAMSKEVDFITFWSTIEGSNTGYLDNSTGKGKPTYYHFQMMADNFKGNYCVGTDNQANVKSFGSKDGKQIAVMILNQEQALDFDYTLRLNTTAVSGNSPLKININAGVDKEFTDKISNQSSILLLFDASGNLYKKIEYKLKGNADSNLPPTVKLYTAPLTATVNPNGTQNICDGGSLVLQATSTAGTTYQWKKDSVNISGATNSSYTVTEPGNYNVEVASQGILAPSDIVTVNKTIISAKIIPEDSVQLQIGDSIKINSMTTSGSNYQWYLNDGQIPGAISTIYTAYSEGKYSLKVSKDGCTLTPKALLVTYINLTPGSTTDVSSSKISESEVLKTYPNPSGGSFTLEFQTGNPDKNKNIDVSIINNLGQSIFQNKYISTNGLIKTAIKMDINLPPGIYVVRLIDETKIYESRITFMK